MLDAFEAERAHLLGLSMGGRIALDFCRRHPARVATLVLADTSAGSSAFSDPEELERFLRLRKESLLRGRTPADIAREVAATLVGRAITPAARAEIIDSLSRLHRDAYLKTLDTVTRYRDLPRFESIQVPTLVVVGEDDRIATPEHARAMARAIPGAEFHEIARAGHISNIERPKAFNAVVLAFLQRHRALAPDARPPVAAAEETLP